MIFCFSIIDLIKFKYFVQYLFFVVHSSFKLIVTMNVISIVVGQKGKMKHVRHFYKRILIYLNGLHFLCYDTSSTLIVFVSQRPKSSLFVFLQLALKPNIPLLEVVRPNLGH